MGKEDWGDIQRLVRSRGSLLSHASEAPRGGAKHIATQPPLCCVFMWRPFAGSVRLLFPFHFAALGPSHFSSLLSSFDPIAVIGGLFC
jgi:hypothetical protein